MASGKTWSADRLPRLLVVLPRMRDTPWSSRSGWIRAMRAMQPSGAGVMFVFELSQSTAGHIIFPSIWEHCRHDTLPPGCISFSAQIEAHNPNIGARVCRPRNKGIRRVAHSLSWLWADDLIISVMNRALNVVMGSLGTGRHRWGARPKPTATRIWETGLTVVFTDSFCWWRDHNIVYCQFVCLTNTAVID